MKLNLVGWETPGTKAFKDLVSQANKAELVSVKPDSRVHFSDEKGVYLKLVSLVFSFLSDPLKFPFF